MVVSLQRGRKVIIPHGNTIIHAGDKIVAFASEECGDELRTAFESPAHNAE